MMKELKGKRGDQEFLHDSPETKLITRRKFFSKLGWGSFLFSLGGFFSGTLTLFLPKITYEPSASFTVGRPSDYKVGDMKLIEAKQVFIFLSKITKDGKDTGLVGFQAVSGICTHLGCAYRPFGPSDTKPHPDGSFYPIVHAHCPCHGSRFDRAGEVVGGPAPTPLPFYHMELTPDGRLVVNKAIKEGYKQVAGTVPGAFQTEGIDHRKYLTPDGRIVIGDLPTGEDIAFL